jgi:exopolyphosphatase/pppGpp-phosphohydrolase
MSPTSLESSIYAAVELGSDSFRLHIGRFDDGALQLVATMVEKVELSASLDEDGMLGSAALRRALTCLEQFRGALDAWHPHAVRVVATTALRMARNAALFLSAAGRALGHPVEIIAGDEAGRLVYLGVANTLGPGEAQPRLVLDIGSASTELVIGEGAVIRRIESFALGAVRQSLTFFAGGRIDAAGFDAAVRSSRSRFAEAGLGARGWALAYGACGTVRALADIARQHAHPAGPLTRASLARLRDAFIDAGNVTRSDHLAGGLALLIGLMEELEIAAVAPVHAGLRVGALWDLHQRARAAGSAALV